MDKQLKADHPLEGLVVLELGTSVAGPFATEVLAEMGATVIKIENPKGGDDARRWGPPFMGEDSAVFHALNRNKYSVSVDLKDPGQVDRLRNFILEKVDVVVQNMRPGTVESLGIGPELAQRSPRLIYCNIRAFGANGPLSARAGYDPLMQAFAGIMNILGEDGRAPVRIGPAVIDMGTGMWAVIGIQGALVRRAATGQGCVLDTSLFETALSWMNTYAAGFVASGELPVRHGSEHPSMAPNKVYRAADDFLMIIAGSDKLFQKLAGVMGHPEWSGDPRFATNASRVLNREVLNTSIEASLATAPCDTWVLRLTEAGVPCSRVQDIGAALAHDQTRALGILQEAPGSGNRLIGMPVSFDGKRPQLLRDSPALGEHTARFFP